MFCLEDIQLGASVCPHCGSNLAPLRAFADKQAALEERIAVLEAEMTARRPTGAEQWSASEAASSASAETAAPSTVTDIKWPHMVDNLLLGLRKKRLREGRLYDEYEFPKPARPLH